MCEDEDTSKDGSKAASTEVIWRDNDVICGRGGGSYQHLGNSAYRYLVNKNKALYLSCKKHEKAKVAQAIVTAIRSQDPPGRFLEKDRATGLWCEIGEKKALDKTSQALREGAPSLRMLRENTGTLESGVKKRRDRKKASKVETEGTTGLGASTKRLSSASSSAASASSDEGPELFDLLLEAHTPTGKTAKGSEHTLGGTPMDLFLKQFQLLDSPASRQCDVNDLTQTRCTLDAPVKEATEVCASRWNQGDRGAINALEQGSRYATSHEPFRELDSTQSPTSYLHPETNHGGRGPRRGMIPLGGFQSPQVYSGQHQRSNAIPDDDCDPGDMSSSCCHDYSSLDGLLREPILDDDTGSVLPIVDSPGARESDEKGHYK